MHAFAPTGAKICGVVELVPGSADIEDGSFKRTEDGIEFQYGGNTQMYWDGQKSMTNKDAQRVFTDENKEEWPENELHLHESEECPESCEHRAKPADLLADVESMLREMEFNKVEDVADLLRRVRDAIKKRPVLGIVMEGGVIQAVIADDPSAIAARVVTIDYDTDSGDEENTTPIPQSDGKTERAYVGEYGIEKAGMDLRALLREQGAP